MIERIAKEHRIPERIFRGLIQTESSGNRWAMAYREDWPYLQSPKEYARSHVRLETEIAGQKTSWGLCQIKGGTARWLGFDGLYLSELLDCKTNLEYGAMYLAYQYNRYNSWEGALAGYNAGSAKRRPTGEYINSAYVERVLNHGVDNPSWGWEKTDWISIVKRIIRTIKGVE